MGNIHINMNKKLIRLTEADLHRIVRESVNKVLNEGKYVNNKPCFTNNELNITRGDRDIWKKYFKEKGKEWDDFLDAYDKHQERQKNKDYEDDAFRKKRERELLIKMLDFMGISLDKWKRMDKEKQDYVWEKYYEERPSSFRNGIVDSPRVQTNDNGEYLGYY